MRGKPKFSGTKYSAVYNNCIFYLCKIWNESHVHKYVFMWKVNVFFQLFPILLWIDSTLKIVFFAFADIFLYYWFCYKTDLWFFSPSGFSCFLQESFYTTVLSELSVSYLFPTFISSRISLFNEIILFIWEFYVLAIHDN